MMHTEKAVLAGGCFWCTEALYKRLKGVITVTPGYAGGTTEHPTYEAVSSGTTGHAEAILIEYDPNIVPYGKLLEIFFHTHNPTTPNQQGADIGSQYRSAIFYQNAAEKNIAERMRREIETAKIYAGSIVTEIVPFTHFYPAENYHQDYYDRNQNQGYCHSVISLKITQLLAEYAEEIKDEFRK